MRLILTNKLDMNKMKTYTYKGLAKHAFVMAAVAFSLTTIFSCNKDFPNKLNPSSVNDTLGINAKTRKVLYIIVDGVRGRALRSLNAPNISKMAKNAIYAYDGLSADGNYTMTNAGAWANMLTGVKPEKHMVTNENFTGNKLATYPSLFTHLKQTNPTLRTTSIAASGSFNTSLAADATASQTFEGSDVAVKNAVKEELKRDDASFVVAQFHSAELAGKTGDYIETTPSYANAILQLDNYVGEIMTSLSNRKNFSNENWLVVVASNKGGVIPADPNPSDFTAYADGSRNNFIVFYNPRFSTLFVPKPDSEHIPYTGNSVRFDYTNATRPVAAIQNTSLYNFGSKGNFTIQFLVKSKAGSFIYPTILSKRAEGFTGAGWNLFLEGENWTFNSSVGGQVKGGKINDGTWHKVTVVFDGVNSKIKGYTDGVFNAQVDMNANNPDNTSALRIGYIPGSENQDASVLMNNLQIYNVALTAQQIQDYACKTVVATSNPSYSKLIGYWPLNDGSGRVLKEVSGKGVNFTVNKDPSWEAFNDIAPTLCAEISDAFYRMVPNNIDIPFEIYQWLGVSVPAAWSLDGKSWSPIYSDIKP